MMPTTKLSTIAQLLCCESLPVNFARMVSELDAVLERLTDVPHRITWDCEDIAIFDLPDTRIVLGWSDSPRTELQGVLTLSAGPSPFGVPTGAEPDYQAICARLVQRIGGRIGTPAVLWHQINCVMTPEWVDLLADSLPDPSRLPAPDLIKTAPDAAPGPNQTAAQGTEPPADHATAKVIPLRDPDLTRLRAALYAKDSPTPYSVPMRLAVHAMNATLIMVWFPVGVTAMTHGLVKGEDMRLASRLMVLTGSVATLMQTPFGQQVAALTRL